MSVQFGDIQAVAAAAAAKSLLLCPTLCDPIDGSPPGSSVHGLFQAGVLEWGAIAFFATKTRCSQINKYFLKIENVNSDLCCKALFNSVERLMQGQAF